MRRPAIFIGSSSESLDVAFSLQASLEYETDPTVWTQEVFRPTSQTLADLVKETARTDFAAFIFAPDDVISVRGELAGRVDEAAVRQTFQGPVHNVWRNAFTYLAPLNAVDEWWDPAPKIAELDRRWSREDL